MIRWEVFIAILLLTLGVLWLFRDTTKKKRGPVTINPNVLAHYCLGVPVSVPRPQDGILRFYDRPDDDPVPDQRPAVASQPPRPSSPAVSLAERYPEIVRAVPRQDDLPMYDLPERKIPVMTPISLGGARTVPPRDMSVVPPMLPAPPHPARPMTGRSKGTVSKGQREAWEALEALTGHEFEVNVRPAFLKNTGIGGRPATGMPLELDCYSDRLKLAVEYNGRQHYEYPHRYNNGGDERKAFDYDDWKRRKCDEHGVYLITVPYTVPLGSIKAYIKEHLRKIYTLPEGR